MARGSRTSDDEFDLRKRSRNYCFTVNNYTASDIEGIQRLAGQCTFIGYGKEIGASGTPHLQGTIIYKEAKSGSAAAKSIPRGSFRHMLGTPQQSWTYCSKDGDIWSDGTLPLDRAGVAALNSDRYAEFIQCAKSGNDIDVDKKLFVQYYSTFQKIKAANQSLPESLVGVCGLWIYGAPGTGKSHSVNAKYPDAYRKQANKWWDGYQTQETVWLDDIDPDASTWIARYLKIWADKWSFSAEVKGGVICIRPKRFIVTSNYTIDQMGFRSEDLAAIKRRFTEIEKVASQQIII